MASAQHRKSFGNQFCRPVVSDFQARAIQHHHEHFNGQGYPTGLSGENIPYEARILSIADSFDAMTSDRPYRRALPAEEAFDYLTRGIDTSFDRQSVEALIQAYLRGAIRTQKERELMNNPGSAEAQPDSA